MSFRALLTSKNRETSKAMALACRNAGIRVAVCSDIFNAIDKVKTKSFSCVIADWADQPEASFLLKRARESDLNQAAVAIAIVDHEPTSAEMRDNRLNFLIYRPISSQEADAVLKKASEIMQPNLRDGAEETAGEENSEYESSDLDAPRPPLGNLDEFTESGLSMGAAPASAADSNEGCIRIYEAPAAPSEVAGISDRSGARGKHFAFCALVIVLAAGLFLWRSNPANGSPGRTPQGAYSSLQAAWASHFHTGDASVVPVTAGGKSADDAYFTRDEANSGANDQPPTLGVVATESSVPESHAPLPKPSDLPLPVPTVARQPPPPPVHVERAAIPDSMKNSPPIERPAVLTVNPAQMMPVGSPQTQTQSDNQQLGEPIAVSEKVARSLLIRSVEPTYPAEIAAQNLHGPVVLQAIIARDGTVEDLKIVGGYFVLGRAAIAAVKQWRFQPYNVNGRRLSIQTTITVTFSQPPA